MRTRYTRLIVSETNKLSKTLMEKFSFIRTKKDVEKLIIGKRLKVNNKIILADSIVNKNDEITILTRESDEPKVNKKIKIVYEDEDILVINKPQNIPIHPTGKYYYNTLKEVLKNKLKTEDIFVTHRLDRETSGVIIFAKNKKSAVSLQKQFEKRQVSKTYVAVCLGIIKKEEIVIDKPLTKMQRGEMRDYICVNQKGQKATTKINLIKHNNTYSLVRAIPITGRQHQIRVHLKSIKHPIVGDKIYNKPNKLFIKYLKEGLTKDLKEEFILENQALHAESIEFTHPKTKKVIKICSKIPLKFINLVK